MTIRRPLGIFVSIVLLVLLSCSEASAQLKIWANEGGDKIAQEELRAYNTGSAVNNSIWNGSSIKLFGAKNEVVSFNLVLEAPTAAVNNISVQLGSLYGPNGGVISSRAASGDGVFDWNGRNIELFFVRYLQIKGISTNTFSNYDERHTPERVRRPWSGPGYASGTWYDRPDHDRSYPEIAVPLELTPSFSIASHTNQSIWSDIYIPKNIPPGSYTGTVTISVGGAVTNTVPLQLQVNNFSLPDTPTAKTMLVYTPYEVNERYFGVGYINPLGTQGPQSILIRDRHFMLAHRHKISLIDTNYEAVGDAPASYEWTSRLDGSLFTSAKGYDGPGAATGNNIFAIGIFGSWPWKWQNESSMWQHTNNWEQWFQANSPATERFLYLDDESHNYSQLQQWAQWIKENPGPGSNLLSMATIDLPNAIASVPSLKAPASTVYIGDPNTWGTAQRTLQSDPKNRFYLYNGHRPATGSFATEDDGVSLRQLAWTQYKMKIDRWFFWQSTYYNNTQGGLGETNVFRQAQTFGSASYFDPIKGMTSSGYSNGDGVLFYPGTDKFFQGDSYNVNGPIASLRLKYWRRGIQDVDYLSMAATINPAATKQIIDAIIPKVLWEYGVDDPNDPTWKRTDISWSTNPDVWEQARSSLSAIITGGQVPTPTPLPTAAPTFTTTPVSGGTPAAPSNLAAAALVPNQLVLSWNDNSNNETSFILERSMDGINFGQVANISSNLTTYTDPVLNAWTTYAYRLRAVNANGSSSYSNYAYKTTLTSNGSGGVPAAPSNLSVAALVNNQLVLSWSDNASNETGFRIERTMDGTNFAEVSTVSADSTTYTDPGLNSWTTYAYRIRAFNAAGNSPYSNIFYKTTLTNNSGTISAAPSNLTGTLSGALQVTLHWRDNSTNETGFKVERSIDGTNFTTIYTASSNSDMYIDNSVARWTTYAYRIRSVNGSGSSTPSNRIHISTPP